MNDGYTVGETFGILLLVCIAIPLYFLPLIVASKRKLRQTQAIGWLNFFLGWTSIAWIVLIIFASLAEPAGANRASAQTAAPH